MMVGRLFGFIMACLVFPEVLFEVEEFTFYPFRVEEGVEALGIL